MQSLGRQVHLSHGEVIALQLPSVEIADVTGRRVKAQLFHVPYMDEDGHVFHLIGLCEIGAEHGESLLFDARASPTAPDLAATVYGAGGPETGSQEHDSAGLQLDMSVDQLPEGIVGTLEVPGEKMTRKQQDWLKHVRGHSQHRNKSKRRRRHSSESAGSSSHSSSSDSCGGTNRSAPSGSISDLGFTPADLTVARLSESLGTVECIVESSPPFQLIGRSYGFSAALGNASSSMLEIVSEQSIGDFLSADENYLFACAVEQLLYQVSVDPRSKLKIPITLRPPYLRKCKIEVKAFCSIEMESKSENEGRLIKVEFTGGELRRRQSGSLLKTAMNVSL